MDDNLTGRTSNRGKPLDATDAYPWSNHSPKLRSPTYKAKFSSRRASDSNKYFIAKIEKSGILWKMF